MNPLRSGDTVFIIPTKRYGVVHSVYGNDKVSLGLKRYPEVEQDNTVPVKKLKKVRHTFVFPCYGLKKTDIEFGMIHYKTKKGFRFWKVPFSWKLLFEVDINGMFIGWLTSKQRTVIVSYTYSEYGDFYVTFSVSKNGKTLKQISKYTNKDVLKLL